MNSSSMVFACLAIAPLGLALILIASAIRKRQLLRMHESQGIRVAGKVRAVKTIRDTDGTTFRGDVQFRMNDGTVTTQPISLIAPADTPPQVGDTITISYLPDEPASARLPVQQQEYRGPLLGFAFSTVLIVVFLFVIFIFTRST